MNATIKPKYTKTILVPGKSFVMTDDNRDAWQAKGPARGVLVDHKRVVTIENEVRTVTNVNRKSRRAFAKTGRVAA